MPVNIQTLQGLFGQASPYGAFLHGQDQAAQEKEKQLQAQKTLADIAATQASTAGVEEDTRLKRAIFGDKVQAAGLENIEKEETILSKRHSNTAAQFENTIKQTLGMDHYVENERTKAAMEKLTHLEKVYEGLGPIASVLDSTPMMERPAALIQHTRKIGLSDGEIGRLLDIPAEQMPEGLRRLSQKAALAAPKHMQDVALEELKHKQARELANLKIAADKAIAKLKDSSPDSMKTLQHAIIAYNEAAAALPDGHPDKEFNVQMAERYISIYLAEAEAKAQPTHRTFVDDKGRKSQDYIGATPPSHVLSPVPSRSAAPTAPNPDLEKIMNLYRDK